MSNQREKKPNIKISQLDAVCMWMHGKKPMERVDRDRNFAANHRAELEALSWFLTVLGAVFYGCDGLYFDRGGYVFSFVESSLVTL